MRARKATQYSTSIDDFARIMKKGNNGGYANNWLVADVKNNEIASLELGLKNVTLERKKDGYFVGSNFPVNKNLIREETNFDPNDMSVSANARHLRWEQLMAEKKARSTSPPRSASWPTTTTPTPRRKKPTSARLTDISICRRAVCRRGSRRLEMPGRCRTRQLTLRWQRACHLQPPPVMPAGKTSRQKNICGNILSSAGSKGCCAIWTRIRGPRLRWQSRRGVDERRVSLADRLIAKLPQAEDKQQDIEPSQGHKDQWKP